MTGQWRHKREGYSVSIATLGNLNALYMKDANDAAWQKAVAYQVDGGDTEEGDSRILIRSERDFLAKFTEASPEQSEGEEP